MAKVKYLGEKAPRTFALPIPFLSHASKTGDVQFEKTGSVQDVEPEQAKAMREEFPELFELVAEKVEKLDKKSFIKSAD